MNLTKGWLGAQQSQRKRRRNRAITDGAERPSVPPECGPHGSEEALAERAADDTDNIEEADRDTAALLPPPIFCEDCGLFTRHV